MESPLGQNAKAKSMPKKKEPINPFCDS